VKVEQLAERTIDVNGWPVHLVSYRLGERFVCVADNVSPGANLARIMGRTREDVESRALERARELLARTQRYEV
jgi:hypothetical protein